MLPTLQLPDFPEIFAAGDAIAWDEQKQAGKLPNHTAVILANLRDQEANSYRVRKDSYTDETTGITHVYFRQVVDGVEVADGDINVNIRDGMVLSYGDSVRSCAALLGVLLSSPSVLQGTFVWFTGPLAR